MIDKRINKPESRLYKTIPVEVNVEGISYVERSIILKKAGYWCIENNFSHLWIQKGLMFYFPNEEEAILFKLRWG